MVSVEGWAPRSPQPTGSSLNKPPAAVLRNPHGAFAPASSLLRAVWWGGGFSSGLERGSRSAEGFVQAGASLERGYSLPDSELSPALHPAACMDWEAQGELPTHLP